MTHLEYHNFFKWAAIHHIKLQHLVGGKSAFGTIIENAPNPFQPKTDLDDFLSQSRSILKYPLLLMISYDASYEIIRDSMGKKIIDGAFVIMDIPDPKRDYVKINEVLDATEIIGEQILAALCGYAEEHNCTIISGEGTGCEKIGPIGDGLYGTKFYVKIAAPANQLITDNRTDTAIWV